MDQTADECFCSCPNNEHEYTGGITGRDAMCICIPPYTRNSYGHCCGFEAIYGGVDNTGVCECTTHMNE